VRRLFCGILAGLCLAQGVGAAMTEEEMFFKDVSEVNEGDLHFLSQAPATPVHHHQNRITLTPSSLLDGWAELDQCHSHIDAVPSTQIVYNAERIRALRISRAENIGKSWVQGPTVQLENVGHDAVICIQAQTRALAEDGEGGFQLLNGPYMRRFLDGYYPMRVSMVVSLQAPELRFRDIEPAAQPGFTIRQADREISYDTLFEGRLNTLIRFSRHALP
jgi:hypothetical protein